MKRILKRFLAKTVCFHVAGNQFREGDILSSGPHSGGMLVVRKEINLQNQYYFTELYCVHNKKYRYRWVNRSRKRFYTWLAYKELFC